MVVASSSEPARETRPSEPSPIVSEQALNAALARLGYDGFRSGQRRAIETLLRDRRLLFVAPTGGGKSLIYQLTACLLGGTTVVVSPLIALMADQVGALEHRARRLDRHRLLAPCARLGDQLAQDLLGRLLLESHPERTLWPVSR